MRKIDLIVIHCAATKPGMDIGAKEIRSWHTAAPPVGRGWKDIGYTFVIRRNGLVENGRDLDGDGDVLEEVGAHVAYHNAHSIGICLVGGIDDRGKPESNFTAAQWKSLENLLLGLTDRFPHVRICGHRDLDNRKACPSFSVAGWLEKTASLRRYA